MTKKILMACGNYWTSPFQVGSHQIAKGFIKSGWEVAFISEPISPLHLSNGINQSLKDRYSIYKHGGISDLNSKIWAYVPGAFATPHNKPLLRSNWIHRYWYKLSHPNVIKKVISKGFEKIDILYIDSINQAFWLDAVEYDKAVFRLADKTSGFSKTTSTALKIEQEIASRVDLVAYSAKNLADYVKSLGPKDSLHLPNGVDFEHFVNGSKEIPQEYKTIKHPIALYVGAIDTWFNYDLINKAASALPEISFVLIGPNKLAKQRLKLLHNIHLLGSRDYKELPPYIHNADIGLIPFDVKGHSDLVNNINPLKLYEYMACGLPVVSVEWDELINLNTPAFLCRTPEEFIKKIKYLSKHEANTNNLKNFTSQEDWITKIDLLLKKIRGENFG